MKRLLAIPILALALAVFAAIAPAAPDDAKGPTCADIADTSWIYSADGATATVDITLGTAPCPWVSYTLVVQDSASDATLVVASDDALEVAPGVVSVTATIPLDDQDGDVCLYATTSVGPHVFDRAPDSGTGLPAGSGCLELAPGGTPGGSGWN